MTRRSGRLNRPNAADGLDWEAVISTFRVISARQVLSLERMARHQDIRSKAAWLTKEERPLALLFISHRWETLEHPDPSGRQLRSIQYFLRNLCTCVEALLVPRQERLRLVPSLTEEGMLQAEEVVRRMFGFGPFSETSVGVGGSEARTIVAERFRSHGESGLGQWLLSRIGVWLDYVCMPQEPLSPEEEAVFRSSLRELDSLVRSSTVIALRQGGDDYAVRGWCAAEFFLASARSFARGLFLDQKRLEEGQQLRIPSPPDSGASSSLAAKVKLESYEQDLAAFQSACAAWSEFEGPMLDITPPDAWSAYRSLQGSGFYTPEDDPNPFRRVLEVVRSLETALIEKWLMSDKPHTFDLSHSLGRLMDRFGLHCAKSDDLVYLGFLLACNGWIETFRPMLLECLQEYLDEHQIQMFVNSAEPAPAVLASLRPLDEDVRALFSLVRPATAATWHSRLTSRSGLRLEEAAATRRLREALKRTPPEFLFPDPARSSFHSDPTEILE